MRLSVFVDLAVNIAFSVVCRGTVHVIIRNPSENVTSKQEHFEIRTAPPISLLP